MVWHRPSDVDYPQVWMKFESKKSGQKFIVKDLSSDYYDIALGYMTNMFLNESAICKPLRILEDPVGRGEMQQKWLQIMRENMAIVCVTDEELPRVAAIHLTLVRDKDSVSQQPREEATEQSQYSKFTRVVQELKHEGQLFDKYGDHYLGSLGLFVLPEYRGLGIATHVLKARIVMCKSLGLRGTATVFSTPGAQAAAAAAGYDVIATRTRQQAQGILHLEHELAVMGVHT